MQAGKLRRYEHTTEEVLTMQPTREQSGDEIQTRSTAFSIWRTYPLAVNIAEALQHPP
jgi:hypothetical protein